jgi:hypothetical protein
MKKEEWGIPAPLFLCIPRNFRLGAVAAFPNKAIKGTKDVSPGDRQITLSIFITESRLENRYTARVTKKVRSLK